MNYKNGEMLDRLQESLEILPGILANKDAWSSLVINRRKPATYRVFTTLPSGLRCCLHKFDVCDTHEAFAHPHPWPGAFAILEGKYMMKVGYSCGGRLDANPVNVTTLLLGTGSCYEIIDPLTWHSVIPLVTTYTVMVNDAPWEADYAHTEVRTTKGKDLDTMPEPELLAHLAKFQNLLRAK